MKSLNSKATQIIQKLYEAMSNPKYMQDEDGNYAKIQNSPNLMPVIIEKVGNLKGYGDIISIVTGRAKWATQGRVKTGQEKSLLLFKTAYINVWVIGCFEK